MSFSQFLAILKARKLLAISIFVITVLGTLVTSLLLPKVYTATATLIINTKSVDPITGYSLQAMMLPGYMATQVDILESQNVALKVVKALKIENNPSAVEKFNEATDGQGDINLWFADLFSKNLEIEPSKESNTINVSYSHANPEFAAEMANAYAGSYLKTNLQLKTEPAKKAAEFFDSQIQSLRQNVEQAQARLSAYQQAHGITATEGRLDIEMARLAELSSQLVLVQAQKYDNESRNRQLKSGSASSSQEVLTSSLIQNLKAQLVIAKNKLSALSKRLGVNHPEYQAALEDVESIRASIARETTKTTRSVGENANVSLKKEAGVQAALEAQKARVLKLKSEQDEMTALVREFESTQRIYDNALLKLGQSNLESESDQTDIAILNKAMAPLEPSSPKLLLNLFISIFLGGVLALLAAIIAELGNRKIRSAEDLSTTLEMDVLADLTSPADSSFTFPWSTKKKQTKKNHSGLSQYQFYAK